MLAGRTGSVGGRILRVGGGFQRRPIHRQQTIATEGFLRAQQGREAVEQRLQRRGQQLLPLLDKCRGRRCFFAVLKPSDEHLPDAVFAHSQQQRHDCFKGQCPGPGEVPARASDIVFGMFPHFPDQQVQPPAKASACISCAAPPKKRFHFLELRRTFFLVCQPLCTSFLTLFYYYSQLNDIAQIETH